MGDASTGRLRRRSRDTLRVKANDGALPLTAMAMLGVQRSRGGPSDELPRRQYVLAPRFAPRVIIRLLSGLICRPGLGKRGLSGLVVVGCVIEG